ncbi:MAG: ABC-2 family transporter protein [Nibricoccus sp.]
MKLLQYFRLWLACARYSITRTMMFRFDFLMWGLVELFWMGVNVALVSVIYQHTESIAGWSKYQMLILVGSSMIVQRLLMGFFWSNLFELGRNIRSGHFDFFLAQPGNLMFMASTRKVELEGLLNVFVATGVVVYAARELGLHPDAGTIAIYVFMLLCGLAIHYSLIVLAVSITFWIIKSEGLEGSYFTLTEFSRLPREAYRGLFKGVADVVFVYALPVVVVSNVPASVLIENGLDATQALWLLGITVVWFALAVFVFHRGLRRYSSASS